MANHLTPDELSKELDMDREEVIRLCVEEGVPIYQGKIDKYLFQAQLQAVGAASRGRPLAEPLRASSRGAWHEAPRRVESYVLAALRAGRFAAAGFGGGLLRGARTTPSPPRRSP